MVVDVIILSNTVSETHFNFLKQTVDSLYNSETLNTFNIIIIESNKEVFEKFKNIKKEIKGRFIIPKLKFNYNLFLNIGLRECKNEYILISNNDVIYHKNWLTNALECFEKDKELLSVSPLDKEWHRHHPEFFDYNVKMHYGYRTSYEFTGWSFLVKREVFNKIGAFDERFYFFYQDNDLAQLYKLFKIKHALCTTSEAHHLLSKSHNTIKEEDKKYLSMSAQGHIFNEKWYNPLSVKKYKRLSLLICTIEGREEYLERLINRLKPQVTLEVEVLVSKDNKELSIGEKRNALIKEASGEYIAFIDDDDWVSEDYINKILKATDHKPDVVGFNSVITFDGQTPRRVELTLNHNTWSHKMGKINNEDHPIVYYRCPNHLSPVKKKLAEMVLFPGISDQEDKQYSFQILPLLKSEIYINEYLYFYDCKCKENKQRKYSPEELETQMKKEKENIELAEKYIKLNA